MLREPCKSELLLEMKEPTDWNSNVDVGMLQLLNAQERELPEWEELFSRADKRYKYVGAHKPDGAIRWIIVAEWSG